MPAGESDEDVVKVLAQFVRQFHHIFWADSHLVPRLRRRDKKQVLKPLVLNHALTQLASPFDNINKIVDDAVFQTHDDVEIAQTNIGINDDDLFAQAG